MRRRDFLKASAAAGSAWLVPGCAGSSAAPDTTGEPDAHLRSLAELAIDEARRAGAEYADCRIASYRRQRLAAREQRVTRIDDAEDRGFGVRVLVRGTWGFAASATVERDEIAAVARRAVALARANARLQRERIELHPIPASVAVWNTPVRRDPFDVSLGEKAALLLSINAAGLEAGATFCRSSLDFVREHKLFASTDGCCIEQTLHRNNPAFTVTSVDRDRGGFETRDSYASPQGLGYEYVADYPWLDDVRQAAEDAQRKHEAKSVEPGERDLVLHPSNLWLTIHESIGHPTEYDRAIGMEANYAGTSFLTPDKLGRFRLASDIVTFQAEKTRPGALATCGYDDDGVRTGEWLLVDRGTFVDYQVTRDQAALLGRTSGHGCSYAQSWKDVPFQRMPNVDLVPPPDGPSFDELVADTRDGILVYGRGSYSIDHQRYNFQFGGQTFYEIADGRVVGMLKDVAYQARTPDFWRSCDAICGPDDFWIGGSFYDGKGEPGQSNGVSHGCSTARFRGVNVLNTRAEV